MSKVIVKAPKRDMFKVIKYADIVLDTSQINRTLYTAEENVTLVRTIIRGTYVNDGASERSLIVIHKSNPDLSVPSIQANTSVDDVYSTDSENQLNLYNHGFRGSSTVLSQEVNGDVKGMRKLRKNETISLSGISNTASGGTFAGTITLFFKIVTGKP